MLVADDCSEFQPTIVRASDGRRLRIFRVAFGAHYEDKHFLGNANEAAREYKAGEIDGVLIYAVPLPSATPAQFVAFIKQLVGPTPPAWLIGIYQDWESWGGTSYSIRGDHSTWANRAYGLLAHYMGSWTAAGFYGNDGDLAALIPHRDARAWVIEAHYGPTLAFTRVKGQVGQQYTDGQTSWGLPVVGGHPLPHAVTGAGSCDHNAFDPKRFPTAAKLRAYMRPAAAPAHAAAAPTPAKPKPTPKPQPQPAAKPAPAPAATNFYPAGFPTSLVSPDRSHAAILGNDGRIIVRAAGRIINIV